MDDDGVRAISGQLYRLSEILDRSSSLQTEAIRTIVSRNDAYEHHKELLAKLDSLIHSMVLVANHHTTHNYLGVANWLHILIVVTGLVALVHFW